MAWERYQHRCDLHLPTTAPPKAGWVRLAEKGVHTFQSLLLIEHLSTPSAQTRVATACHRYLQGGPRDCGCHVTQTDRNTAPSWVEASRHEGAPDSDESSPPSTPGGLLSRPNEMI